MTVARLLNFCFEQMWLYNIAVAFILLRLVVPSHTHAAMLPRQFKCHGLM